MARSTCAACGRRASWRSTNTNISSMPEKLQLDLPLLLPEVPDARDACVRRLIGSLESREGVERVHVVEASNAEPARLCIHYDRDVMSIGRIRWAARQAGAEITSRFGHVILEVRGIPHRRRARTVSERLKRSPGVLEAEATATGPVRIEFDRTVTSDGELLSVLGDLGVSIARKARTGEREEEKEEHVHGGILGERAELVFSVISGLFVGLGFALSYGEAAPSWLSQALYVGAYFFGGFFTAREAVDSVRVGRLEVDFLMIIAAAGAAVLGNWVEGGFLLFLFSMGHALEHYAMGRARRAIEALAELAPDVAVVRRDGQERQIPVEELEIGDTVIVRTNERIPADGFVARGTSAVNQAPVTGESVPVDKRPVDDPQSALSDPERLGPEHRVFAGTINGSGSLEVIVARRASETTMARVVQMVAEAETQRSPTQRFTDRFERIFVPSILALVVVLLFAWVAVDEPFSASFYRALAVLVAASPCALAISTPSAVLAGVARAGRGGVLVKGGEPLENLGALSAIAFDKTGTLTEGKPRVTDTVLNRGVTEEELLCIVVAVEKQSDHPLAAAVVRYGEERLGESRRQEAHNLEGIAGRGVRGDVEGERVYVGKPALFGEVGGPPLPNGLRASIDALEREGRTTMVVRRGDRYLGILGLMDTPREFAPPVIARLREIGIRRMIMISGDNQPVVDAVARQVGIDEAVGDLMPDQKVDTIRKLRREQKVAMVGDGVNDAPAMAHATVGIAMGAAGSDVALETADVALMADDLRHLPFAVGLSRHTRRIIRQNLLLSLGMVAFLIPAAILGLGIGPAVSLHEGSTIVVVLNALRLLAYRAPAWKSTA